MDAELAALRTFAASSPVAVPLVVKLWVVCSALSGLLIGYVAGQVVAWVARERLERLT